MSVRSNRSLPLTLRRSIFVWLLFAAGIGSAISAPQLITQAGTAKTGQSGFDIKSKATAVMLNRQAMAKLKVSDELEISLPNATRYTVVFDRTENHGGEMRSSVGYLKDFGKDFRVILTSGSGGTFGSIRTPETMYRIIPGNDGQDLLVDMSEEQKHIPYIDLGNDARRVPEKHVHDPKNRGLPVTPARSPEQASGSVIARVAPTPQVTIDLMIVYTSGLAARLGANLSLRLQSLVTAANTAYINSEVAITLRLVNATMVNYTDAPGDEVALDAITPALGGGTGVFANIESIRNANGADMVSFLRTGSDFGGSGIAWITTSATPNPAFMYSVITGCVVGCESVFIHELGHNMGNAHDRATAAFQEGGVANPPAGAKPYSFGHFFCASGTLTCNPNLPPGSGGCNSQPQCSANSVNNIGTIMSYFNPVVLKFSNPALTCAQTGGISQPCGVANQNDNARSMNEMRFALASVKPTVVGSSFAVTPSITSAYGSISPNTVQTINQGTVAMFNVVPIAGYNASVGGTCGGTLAGTTYTTNAINAPCTVIASFTLKTYAVTASTTTANGTISPNAAQTINHGATAVFTITANPGFTASVGGTCSGKLVGGTYTTAAITGNCTVIASFAALASSTTVLNSSRNPSTLAQPVTFTATVSGGGATPTGTVVFKDGGVTIGGCAAVPLSAGVAQCVTASLLIGTHPITAQYSGSGSYNLSNSNTVTQTVNAINLQPILFFFLD